MNSYSEDSAAFYSSFNDFLNPKDSNDFYSLENEMTDYCKINEFSSTFLTNYDSKEKNKEIKNGKEKKKISVPKISLKTSKKKNKTRKIEDKPMRKKVQDILSNNAFEFINKKIKDLYNNNIGNGVCIKELKPLQSKKFNVDNNKKFLYGTIANHFSGDINKRNTNFDLSHNKNLIKDLLNEKDIIKRNYFEELFNLTFLQYLKHFRGDDDYEVLIGVNRYINEIQKYQDDKDYQNELKRYIFDYENILNRKRSREDKKIPK